MGETWVFTQLCLLLGGIQARLYVCLFFGICWYEIIAFLFTVSEKGILPEETKETADIFNFFDELFDSVNGSFRKNKFAKPLLGPVQPKSLHHKNGWNLKKH